MATDPAGRFDPVRWAEALGCRDVDDLAAALNRACGRVDAIAADVAALQSSLAGLGEADQDTEDMLLRFRALAEAVWMVLDVARRTAVTAAGHATPSTSTPALTSGGVR